MHGAPGRAYNWVTSESAIVEPYRVTTFVATGKKHTDSTLLWRINGRSMSSSTSLHSEFEHQFTEVGTYNVEVEEWRPSGTMTEQSTSALVHCRYVRREMRSLTTKDRTALIDAMVTLWDAKTIITKNIYGFAEQHALLAGNQQCDHMHDGMGFFTQHLGLTLEFEQALQTINPLVTVPYWDFTIDAHDIMGMHAGDCK